LKGKFVPSFPYYFCKKISENSQVLSTKSKNFFSIFFSNPLPPPPPFLCYSSSSPCKEMFQTRFQTKLNGLNSNCLFSPGILPHLSVEAFAAAATVEDLAVLVARGMPQQIV
jgi:hypothetical protein